MSRAWKWVLGIIAVLVVLAVIAGGIWFWQNRGQMMTAFGPYAARPNTQVAPFGPNGQNFPNGPRGFGNNGQAPFRGYGFRGPFMGNRMMRFGPFGMGFFFLGGLLRLIIPLGVLVLVAFLFYQLGKRAGISKTVGREPAPVATTTNQNPPSTD